MGNIRTKGEIYIIFQDEGYGGYCTSRTGEYQEDTLEKCRELLRDNMEYDEIPFDEITTERTDDKQFDLSVWKTGDNGMSSLIGSGYIDMKEIQDLED